MQKLFAILISTIAIIQCSVTAQNIHNPFFDELFHGRFDSAAEELKQIDAFLLEEERLLLHAFFALQKDEAGVGNSDLHKSTGEENAKKVLALLKRQDLTDRQIFYYMSALGIVIKLKMDRQRYFAVARDLYKLSSKIEYVIENEYENAYFILISGLYHYYAELATEDYPMMRSVFLFLPRGDKTHGLKMLKSCTDNADVFVSNYAVYYLARIYHRDEKEFSLSNHYFKKLLSRYPENCQQRREYIDMLLYFKQIDKAVRQSKILEMYSCR